MYINALNSFESIIPQIKNDKASSQASFENVLSEQTKNPTAEDLFRNLFSTYNVSCKIGECNVSREDWERNDFPSWKFFEEGTKANALNHWSASGNDSSFLDNNIVSSWNKTDNRQMVILIPDQLAARMESDPDYAEQVLDKVYSWQKSHADLEKALSEGYGYNGELSTFLDSYLLRLDEAGNVTDYVVTGPGYDSSFSTDYTVSDQSSTLTNVKKRMVQDQASIKQSNSDKNNLKDRIPYDDVLSFGIISPLLEQKKRI